LPPLTGQSAFERQGVPAASLQVSHWHFRPVKPAARQSGLSAEVPKVTPFVVAVASTTNSASLKFPRSSSENHREVQRLVEFGRARF
jgi:hypothetical protein